MKAVKPDAPQKAIKPDSSLKADYSIQPIMGVPLYLITSRRAWSTISYMIINGKELDYARGPLLVAKAGAFLKERGNSLSNNKSHD